MLHQLSFKLLSGLFGITRDKSKALMILLASILLTACGGSESTKEALLEPGPDGVNPTISNLLAVNQCNYTKSVGPDNTIIFDITGSESLMKPTVTILGEAVEITGQHKSWQGKYTVTGPMENNYPTVSELQIEIKEFISTFSDATPAVEEIFDYTAFSVLGSSALASALSTKYGIAITEEDQLDPAFAYGTLFDRTLEAQLPSVKIFKETVAQFNDPILDSNGNEIEIPLQFLSLGLPTDNGEPNEVIKEIMSVFGVKTTQGELDKIAQADVPQYAWIDKIQELEIPVTISYADNSGMEGEDITLTSTDALRYCEDGVCQCFPEDISGEWQLRPKAGSMGVGRAEGDIGDWFATDFIWGTERACLWDDKYIFKAVNANNPQSGSFVQIMGDSTWLEPWQSPNAVEECGTPQSPFDGSTDDMTYQWNIEEGTLTLFGFGAHIGLPRVANDEENTGAIPFDRPVVYTIQTASDDLISLNIKTASASPWWHFELAKVGSVVVDDSDLPVDDTPLELDSINIDSNANTITLALSGSAGTSAPLAADFQITQAGQTLVVDSVSINGSTFVLNIIDLDEGSVQLSYTPSDDNQALLGFTQMVVSDGYIRNAEVYADDNNNGIADSNELLEGVTSDALGQLMLGGDYGDTQIIIKGGVNVDTGAINNIELTAPAGYSVINPLSTLVQKIVASDESQTLEQAEEILTQALGITLAAGEAISSYDPISDVSENALTNRVATTQIATVLAVAAAADEADTSGDLDIEETVLGNLVELMTTASDVVTLDNSTVVSILSDDSGSLVSTEDLTAVTTAVDAMEAIKQSSGSGDIATALNQMIQAQAEAIDNVIPATPVLSVDAGELTVSFNTTLENGSAIVVGDTLEIFDADSSFSTYVLQKADIDQGFYTLELSSASDIDTQYTATILDIAGNISNQSAPVVYETVAPAITSAASGSIVENSGADQIIYTAEANEDANFSLVGSYAALSINPTTGAVTLNVDPDFEVKPEYSFTVIATDALGYSSAALQVTVVVTNIDEAAPNITSASVAVINENSGAGQSFYTAEATDAEDVSGGVSFSLADETLGFSIDVSTGVVTTNAGFTADFETAQSQSFTLVATDVAANSAQQVVTVAIIDVDEVAPTITSGASGNNIDENLGAGQVVYTAVATDDSAVTYSLVDANLGFSIDEDTGVVTTNDDFVANFEAASSQSFVVVTTDAGGNASQQGVTVAIIDVDEAAPVFESSATASVLESEPAGVAVYQVLVDDSSDISNGVTYSLSGVDVQSFDIDQAGVVSIIDNPEAAVQSTYAFTVIADDGLNQSQQAVTLTVIDQDLEAPVFTSSSLANAIDENIGVNQVVYTALASDDTVVTFSLEDDYDSGLSIDASTGEVSLDVNPDFEVKSEYLFGVIATDTSGNVSDALQVTVNVIDIDEVAPTITSGASGNYIDENSGADQVVYTAVGTDDTAVTYSLVDVNLGFSIDEDTGVVTTNEVFTADFETSESQSFTVVATDAAGNPSEQLVTIAVNNLDDTAPTITSAVTAEAIDENSGAGQVIYIVTADDSADVADTPIAYSLAEGSDAALTIDSATGAVTLTTNPVYDTQSQYNFSVIATDAAGNASDAHSVTLTIIEVAGGDTGGDTGSTLPTTGNLVTDGTFDQATSTTWTGVYNPIDGVNVADVTSVGNAYDVNLSGTVDLTPGATYTLTFDVIGAEGRTIIAGIGQSSDPWFNNTETVTLSAASQTMVLHLTAKADGVGADFGDATSRVIFDMGADTGAVNIDNVSLVAGHIGTVNLGAGNDTGGDTGGDTPPAYGRQGPLDMTGAYGNGAISGADGEFFKNDPSLGLDYSGFASLTTELYPFEFGTGGTLEFTASVPPGESVDVSFQLQKQGSDAGLLCEYGPVWDSGATTVSSANAQTFTIEIPAKGGDTFSNMIMQLSEDDIDVKITDVFVTTSEKTDAEQTVPAQCDGSLDMTGAYGNGAVSGELGEFFMNDTSLGLAFSGFANTTTDVYPYEFGTGGTLEFTASVPEGQSTTAVDVNFQFQKQGSDTGKFCDIAPIWEASNTVSGPVEETFTVAIPSQGGNTFSNLIMELSVDDVIVKITGVKVTPSDKTADAPTVPEICVASPFPSVYPVDGLNSAAMFNGTFGDEEGGLATIQYEDTFEFPTGSAVYGGWSNSNQALYPIEYIGGGFFAQKKIYFCASTTEAATVYFRFENEVYPANSTIYNTAEVSLTADGVMRAYASDVKITYPVNSLLFLMLERDTAITMGKVMGNWNGLPTQNITIDTDGDGVVDYCEDFPNDTPDWVDTDNDGASDEVDAFPDDATQWEAATP